MKCFMALQLMSVQNPMRIFSRESIRSVQPNVRRIRTSLLMYERLKNQVLEESMRRSIAFRIINKYIIISATYLAYHILDK